MKAVVLFTDGVDTSRRRATYESTVRQAEESDALIYRPNHVVLSRDSHIYSRKKADAKEAGGHQLAETEARTKHLVGIR